MAVAGDVGLVDQNGREGSHDGVDGLDHRPDQVGAAQLFRPGSVAELADFAAVGADRPGQDAEEGDCGVDCFDDEEVAEDFGVDEHYWHLDLQIWESA